MNDDESDQKISLVSTMYNLFKSSILEPYTSEDTESLVFYVDNDMSIILSSFFNMNEYNTTTTTATLIDNVLDWNEQRQHFPPISSMHPTQRVSPGVVILLIASKMTKMLKNEIERFYEHHIHTHMKEMVVITNVVINDSDIVLSRDITYEYVPLCVAPRFTSSFVLPNTSNESNATRLLSFIQSLLCVPDVYSMGPLSKTVAEEFQTIWHEYSSKTMNSLNKAATLLIVDRSQDLRSFIRHGNAFVDRIIDDAKVGSFTYMPQVKEMWHTLLHDRKYDDYENLFAELQKHVPYIDKRDELEWEQWIRMNELEQQPWDEALSVSTLSHDEIMMLGTMLILSSNVPTNKVLQRLKQLLNNNDEEHTKLCNILEYPHQYTLTQVVRQLKDYMIEKRNMLPDNVVHHTSSELRRQLENMNHMSTFKTISGVVSGVSSVVGMFSKFVSDENSSSISKTKTPSLLIVYVVDGPITTNEVRTFQKVQDDDIHTLFGASEVTTLYNKWSRITFV